MFCIELSYLHITVVLLLIIILFKSEFLYSVLRVKLCLFIFHTLFRWALGSKKHGNFKELKRSYSLNSWLKNKTSRRNNWKKKKKLFWYSWLLILLFILENEWRAQLLSKHPLHCCAVLGIRNIIIKLRWILHHFNS